MYNDGIVTLGRRLGHLGVGGVLQEFSTGNFFSTGREEGRVLTSCWGNVEVSGFEYLW
jgi:hypothetical protein